MDSVAGELTDWLAQMPDVDPEVEALRQRIGRTARLFDRILDQVAEQQQVSRGDWSALSVLVRAGRPCTPTELMRELELTSGTISTRLKRLVAAGLAELVDGGTDARSRPVRPTRRGRRIWAAATAERTRREAELVRRLGDSRVQTLNRGLGRLLETLEDELGRSGEHDLPRE
ncbi:MarR family winged helix-turn-helix transcriptional regulator [Propionibacteriaceae bacterium Y1700]|uniref:MarR family winged helix-turn-helix transcriptional regulator n=1 Tax=Microlunatus sp. Y1700 TaxID=3418487 RepID=UPI003DA7420D